MKHEVSAARPKAQIGPRGSNISAASAGPNVRASRNTTVFIATTFPRWLGSRQRWSRSICRDGTSMPPKAPRRVATIISNAIGSQDKAAAQANAMASKTAPTSTQVAMRCAFNGVRREDRSRVANTLGAYSRKFRIPSVTGERVSSQTSKLSVMSSVQVPSMDSAWPKR
jgi:hypothetical protein